MNKRKTLISAFVTMLLWGSLFPMVKLGFSSYEVSGTADILLFAGIRFVICGAVICVFAGFKDRSSYKPVRHSLVPILLSGAFAIILHYGFTYVGLSLTDSFKTAIIKQIGALLYVCFSFLFIKEDRPTLSKIFGALLGFLGIVALNLGAEGFSFSIGDMLILCASFCTVISNVISKRVFERVSPITSTGVSQLFGGAVLLAVGLAMGGGVRFRVNTELLIMGYICIASIVSYCIWYGIVKHGELSHLFIIKFSEPLFACIFGCLILGEDIFKVQNLLAFILVGAGIWLSNLKRKSKNKAEKTN